MTDEEFARLQAHLEAELNKKTLLNWLFWREERMERTYISGEPKDLRLLRNHLIWSYAAAAASWIALIVLLNFAPEWSWLAAITAGGFTFSGAMVMRSRASSYRSGWLAGRRALYAGLREAEKTGLPNDVFVMVESERDFHVLW